MIVQCADYNDKEHCSTGSAEEFRTASRINQTSALENAETSAVGRALAMLGLTNDNIASSEEVSLAISHQDKALNKALKRKNSEYSVVLLEENQIDTLLYTWPGQLVETEADKEIEQWNASFLGGRS